MTTGTKSCQHPAQGAGPGWVGRLWVGGDCQLVIVSLKEEMATLIDHNIRLG